jgi:endonuclease III related protein
VTLGVSAKKPGRFSDVPERAQPALDAPRRLRGFYDHLVRAYGPRQWWPAKTSLEVVIGAYLTQNTAWTSVERSIANLEARELLSVEALREIPEEELRVLIRPSGYMIRKTAAIKAFVAFLDETYGGSMEKLAEAPAEITRPQLLALPGVGPETADAILLYALGQPAMVVDEYLRRVVTRHGLLPAKARYAEIQRLALEAFHGDEPASLRKHFNEFHAVIVEAGKLHCRRTPKCDGCPLAFDLKRIGGEPVLS